MPDLSQCLCSRVPPLHSALAPYNDGVSWYCLLVPPCTLPRVLFERSCTYTINTCISHIFDVFDVVTIYSICILNTLMTYLCMMATHMHLLVEVLVVGEIPSWMHLPTWMAPLRTDLLSFSGVSLGFVWSSPFLEYKLTNSKNNHEHLEMMLCNDFPG